MTPRSASAVAHRRDAGAGTAQTDTPFIPAVFVKRLRSMCFTGLAQMYDASERTFVFRVRPTPGGVVQEGHSLRYTAITLIGLAGESRSDVASVTSPHTLHDVCGNLLERVRPSGNLGDVALSLFAGTLMDRDDVDPLIERIGQLGPADRPHPVVEVAWTLSALSLRRDPRLAGVRDRVADRLMAAFNGRSSLFPHVAGAGGARSHLSCFADIIYPIQALSMYAAATGDRRALGLASTCAAHLSANQGAAGQWWWHYDYRTGRILEKYPVYAIHQDAMGPMGLFALKDAGGPDFTAAIIRGLKWLASAPELRGGSLVDDRAGLIWRKVARREPRKVVRYLQATAARVHSALRVPAVDKLFPPTQIDYEDRPYHLGWLLYAWRGERESTLHPCQEHA